MMLTWEKNKTMEDHTIGANHLVRLAINLNQKKTRVIHTYKGMYTH